MTQYRHRINIPYFKEINVTLLNDGLSIDEEIMIDYKEYIPSNVEEGLEGVSFVTYRERPCKV